MQFAWVIVGFLVGVAVGHYFWTRIEEWANRVLGSILDDINTAFQVASNALVSLVKEGTSGFVRRMVVYIRDIRDAVNNNTRVRYAEERISSSQIPAEFRDQLDERENELPLLQLQTGR
jgi:hypothetical protein